MTWLPDGTDPSARRGDGADAHGVLVPVPIEEAGQALPIPEEIARGYPG